MWPGPRSQICVHNASMHESTVPDRPGWPLLTPAGSKLGRHTQLPRAQSQSLNDGSCVFCSMLPPICSEASRMSSVRSPNDLEHCVLTESSSHQLNSGAGLEPARSHQVAVTLRPLARQSHAASITAGLESPEGVRRSRGQSCVDHQERAAWRRETRARPRSGQRGSRPRRSVDPPQRPSPRTATARW